MKEAKEEIRRVSYCEYSEAYSQMLSNFDELTGMVETNRIQFYFDYDRNAESDEKPWNRPSTMQVNWAAIGTVMPSEAAEFANALRVAAKLAAGFKFNGFKVRHED